MRGVKGSRQGKGTQGPVTGKEKFQAELYIKHHTSVQVKSDNLETKNLLPIPDGIEKNTMLYQKYLLFLNNYMVT